MTRTKLLGMLALLSILLIIPLVFSSGIVNVVQWILPRSNVTSSTSSSPTVFVDPVTVLDHTLQSGSTFTVHVNVSAVADLFAWQINVTWNPSILSVNSVLGGEFLLQTTSENKTASYELGFVMNATDNVKGCAGMSESILEDLLPGDVPGISGSGRLVSIEFLVVGYGSTDLTIDLTSTLQTTLLDSTGATISFAKMDGYFRNKYPGDINGDKYVGSTDAGILAMAYGSSKGQPTYNREADLNVDDYVGSTDAGILAGNYGITFP